MEGEMTWGGEHAILCTGDLLQSRIPETYIILVTYVTCISSVIRKKQK